MDGLGKLGSYRSGGSMYDDIMGLSTGETLSPSEPLTGLMLGRHRVEYGDHCFPPTSRTIHGGGGTLLPPPLPPSSSSGVILMSPASSLPVSSTAAVPSGKRSRASYQNMQNPCCQVEGCNLDLKLAKDYHRRHRICETHSKSPKVIVSGMERRFCQQCSRFHELSEFDDKKRSCRRRLSDHNARRRRVQPESIHLSPSIYNNSSYETLVLNGLPAAISYTTTSTPNLQMDDPVDSSRLSSSINPEKSSWLQIMNEWNTMTPPPPDVLSAHSLLSSTTTAWSFNEGESSSMMHTTTGNNYDTVMQQSVLLDSNAAINPSSSSSSAQLVSQLLLHPIDNSSHLFYDHGRFL